MLCALLALVVTACGEPHGRIELGFVLPAAGTSGLTALTVEPVWGGVNRGPVRDADWQQVPATEVSETFPTAGDRPILVTRGRVPAGRYDRVFVETPRVTARTPDGQRVTLVSHIEPAVHPVDIVAGETTAVDIELVVLPLPKWEGSGWTVFVKSARTR